MYSGVREYVEKHIVWDASEGEIEFQLRPDQAPNTCWNYMQLVGGGFYTDIIFHRIINRLPSNGKRFVAQVGDPTSTGGGGPGYFVDLEASRLPHDFGVLSMAPRPQHQRLAGVRLPFTRRDELSRRLVHRVRPGRPQRGRDRPDRQVAHGSGGPPSQPAAHQVGQAGQRAALRHGAQARRGT